MRDQIRTIAAGAVAMAAVLALSGCKVVRPDAEENASEPDAAETSAADTGEAVAGEGGEPEAEPTASIFGPEAGLPEPEPEPEPEPLNATIGFPDSGTELDDAARKALDDVLASEQMKAGGAITLGGHSDSEGDDAANLRSSRWRAEVVRDYLTDKGVDKERITVVGFGEQNPLQPNALPDGSPNEEGRKANRRVEVEIAPAKKEPAKTPAAPATPAVKPSSVAGD